MNTYLFVWNPELWNWVELDKKIEELNVSGKTTERWSCRSHKKIRRGDRAFLLKLGTYPKGIIGSGEVVSEPFLARHWSGENKLVPRVLIEFDTLLNPQNDSFLTLDILKEGLLANYNWTPQASGVSIPSNLANELEAVWFDFTENEIKTKPSETNYTVNEGNPVQMLVTRYERNSWARNECIKHYGLNCAVCNLNFKEIYGEIGADFIHVHHIIPISKRRETYKLDPIKDLRPVCPNCHSMIHKRKEPFSIEEMKQIYSNPRT